MVAEHRLLGDRWSVPILVALALAAYAPVLGLSFFGDDFHVLYRLGVDRDLGTGSFFRPLPDWTHALNWWIAGPKPWAFRMVNVALLGLNGWLVFRLTRSLQRDVVGSPWTPRMAGVLFVLYPFHLEPQLWIVGRSTAMATTFTLAALVIARSALPDRTRQFGVALFALLGPLCYESALLLPLLLLALWPATGKGDGQPLLRLVGIALAFILLNLLMRMLFTGQVANTYGTGFLQHPWHHYPTSAVKVAARLFLPPVDDERLQLLRALVLILLLVLGTWWIWRRTAQHGPHRRAWLAAVLLLAVSCMLPAITGVSTRTGESDRFLYLPSAFLCMAVALAIAQLSKRSARVVVIVLLLVCSSVLLWRGFRPWKAASSTVDRVLEQVSRTSAPGTTYIVGLPGDVHGAYVFRNGFEHALLLHGADTARIQRRGPVLEVRSGREEARYEVVGRADGNLLLTDTDTTFLRPFDAVWAWRSWQFDPVWP
jgi:hypothetical protein